MIDGVADAAKIRRGWRLSPGQFVEPLLPFAIALVIGAVVLLIAGHDPIATYRLMATEALGGERRIAAALSAATPILFTGLATAIAFRGGVFNVGVEGCFYLGGIVAAVIGYNLAGIPGVLIIVAAMFAAAAVGALWMAAPGLLKARLGVDEVVSTLMLNFVAINLTAFLVNGPLLAPGAANSATRTIVAEAELPRLLPPSTLNLAFPVALLCIAAYAWWNRYTVFGFETRLAGLNPAFCRAVGIDVPRLIVSTMILSGLIGGLAGGLHTLGIVHRFVAGFSPGYGFTGIAVALLGRNSAVGIILASLLFGALASAGTTVQLFSDIPIEIVQVLQGTVMVFAVAQLGLLWSRNRRARA
jgi:simple sugar transport system permease protein